MMKRERFDFEGSRGYRLAGLLEKPDGEARGWVVFAHCFTCGKDNRAASYIARELVGAGYGVFRFDFTGLGESEGAFASSGFSSDIEDVIDAYRTLEARGIEAQILMGHSFGGTAVLAAAEHLPKVRALVTVNAPAEPQRVLRHFEGKLGEIAAEGSAEVLLAGRPFRIAQAFVEDIMQFSLKERLGKLKAGLLVMHALGDETVALKEASEIFAAARHPKSFVAIPEACHLLRAREVARHVGQLVAAWATPYVI